MEHGNEGKREAELSREERLEKALRLQAAGFHALLVRAALDYGKSVLDGDREIGRRLTLSPRSGTERWAVKGWTDENGVSYIGVGLADDPADGMSEAEREAAGD